MLAPQNDVTTIMPSARHFASDHFLFTILLLRRVYRAPSPSNAERNEFRHSRLFEVTGRLIGLLMIYGGYGWGWKRADILTVVFFGTRLGELQCLYHVYLEEFAKCWRDHFFTQP